MKNNPLQNKADVQVPVVEEEIAVETRRIETGHVRINKRVHEHEEVVDYPLLREEVEIERVPVNRFLESAPPAPRMEGETLILPLIEEVLVVEKRLMLKEELHIRRKKETVHAPQTVVLRKEEVTVERAAPNA